jgi:predicted dehydrogenase
VIGFGWVARDYAVPGCCAGGRARRGRRSRTRRAAAAADSVPRAHADWAALLADPAVQAV